MKVRLEVEYHPKYEGHFEAYVARILDYPELPGYGNSPQEAIKDALAVLDDLGKSFKVVREDVAIGSGQLT